MCPVDSYPRVPSIEEQIEALIQGKLPELREAYAPQLDQDEGYRTILTFRRSDIVRHLINKYQLDQLIRTESDPLRDGFYAIRTAKGFEVYYQERGVKIAANAPTEEAVWVWFSDWLLRTSGTALKFDR